MKLVEFTITFSKKTCWSDYAIALHWLKKEPNQLQAIVANHIGEIHELSENTSWRHISGPLNPADLISQGITKNEIINNDLWWHGPRLLVNLEDDWPDSIVQLDLEELEFKGEFKKFQVLTSSTHPESTIAQLVNSHSNLFCITRIVAIVRRCAFNSRAKAIHQLKRSDPVTTSEMQEAELTIIRNMQRQHFTKAIHLEVVSELSTKAFIAALDRFFSRREKSAHMFSDNGTKFVGANNHLKEVHKFLINTCTDSPIKTHLLKQGIEWHHTPARNPEHGGLWDLWEAGVKLTKHHINRDTQNVNLHFEELSTQCRIEAILDSQPLMPLSTDPNDLEALTNGHILIGRSLLSMPQRTLSDVSSTRLERWDRVVQLQQDFWSRWSRDYRHRLQVRRKSYKDRHKVKTCQIVLLYIDNYPPMHWPLGIIIHIFPGKDGITRVARIRTGNTTLDRPINKLAILPTVDNECDDSNPVKASNISIAFRRPPVC